jgi:hypothetical protein
MRNRSVVDAVPVDGQEHLQHAVPLLRRRAGHARPLACLRCQRRQEVRHLLHVGIHTRLQVGTQERRALIEQLRDAVCRERLHAGTSAAASAAASGGGALQRAAG